MACKRSRVRFPSAPRKTTCFWLDPEPGIVPGRFGAIPRRRAGREDGSEGAVSGHPHNEDRPNMSLDGDAPVTREIEPRELGKVVALPRVSGLHYRYIR
jgi:hypothetical protein